MEANPEKGSEHFFGYENLGSRHGVGGVKGGKSVKKNNGGQGKSDAGPTWADKGGRMRRKSKKESH